MRRKCNATRGEIASWTLVSSHNLYRIVMNVPNSRLATPPRWRPCARGCGSARGTARGACGGVGGRWERTGRDDGAQGVEIVLKGSTELILLRLLARHATKLERGREEL